MKRKVIALMLTMFMMFGVANIESKAATVVTSVHSSTGPYTLYVRESGSSTLLGTMSLSKSTSSVTNIFTAAKNCGATTAYVSQISSGYSSKSVTSLSKNASVIASKNTSNPTKVYGYCSVSY